MIRVNLPQGIYTVQLEKDGYETAWFTVTVQEGEGRKTAYCVKKQEQQPVWSIVLTRNNNGDEPLDLDSCIFTPRQSMAGNMEYVNPVNQDDGQGTSLWRIT